MALGEQVRQLVPVHAGRAVGAKERLGDELLVGGARPLAGRDAWQPLPEGLALVDQISQ